MGRGRGSQEDHGVQGEVQAGSRWLGPVGPDTSLWGQHIGQAEHVMVAAAAQQRTV